MQIRPILSALKRNKVGAVLIALQVALTLAIVCNALFIIGQRLDYVARPTGLDEANIIVLENSWIGHGTGAENKALLLADLQALRSLPGVLDAFANNSWPLSDGGWSEGFGLKPDQEKSTSEGTMYFGDEHALESLGVKLVAGRNFKPEEVMDREEKATGWPDGMLVTKGLADKLFPDGDALGKPVYIEQKKPTVIIGIVERIASPWVNSWGDKIYTLGAIMPVYSLSRDQRYIVRAKPGQLNEVMQSIEKKLNDVTPLRVVGHLKPFTEVRAEAYKGDTAMVIMLTIVCVALLLITALGIVGLASFWVTQRRKQIGVRRALGATRSAILAYFMTENFLISLGGVMLGVILSFGLNLWLVSNYEMHRMSWFYVPVGAILILLLGQVAVYSPARRAASVPPAVATRSA